MQAKIALANRLIASLDVPSQKEAMNWVKRLMPAVTFFKVGLELFCSAGPTIVKRINEAGGYVFLDLKFLDIPNTMVKAVSTAAKTNPFMLNVHALAGATALSKCVQNIRKENKKTKLIAVTILTSYSESELKKVNIKTPIDKTVISLCQTALKAGLDGVVASPLEVKILRKKFGTDFLIVTPGVRPAWVGKNDQKRTGTAYNAIRDGADYVVVGRPILEAEDPLWAIKTIKKEIREAL